MNKQDRQEFDELKRLIQEMAGAKFDPENGWKTARAIFETNTVNALNSINEKLEHLKEISTALPELTNTVNDNLRWRKKMNRVMIWVGMGIGTPILSGLGYLIWKSLTN